MNYESDKSGCAILGAIGAFCFLVIAFFSYTIIGPDERGIQITMGKVRGGVMNSGLNFKMPFISQIRTYKVSTQRASAKLDVFSKDLQSVELSIDVLYHYTPDKVMKLATNYTKDPLRTILDPLVQETMKEVCKDLNSEEIVNKRDLVSDKANKMLKERIAAYDIFTIERLVMSNVELSPKLNQAIEAKMIQEQESQKAKFTQRKKGIDAETARIEAEGVANAEIEKAKGKAKAIEIEATANALAIEKIGKALKENPLSLEELRIKRWNGTLPTYWGGNGGNFGILLQEQAK